MNWIADMPLIDRRGYSTFESIFLFMEQTKEDVIKAVGKNVRKFRKEKKMSIENLSSVASIDYSQLVRIENGKVNTSIYNMFLIAEALNIAIAELLLL